MTTETIEIFLLGMPQVICNGHTLTLERRKALALLAYLATTNQQHSRDMLSEFLFPESDTTRSRGALRRVLAVINKSAIARWIDASRDSIGLYPDAPIWIDVQQFYALISDHSPEALQQAVDLYKDNFLAGFTLKDSIAFDNWQSTTMQDLQQKLFGALENLSQHYAMTDNDANATAILRRWLMVDPLQELAQYRLIQLYASKGQHTAALDQYEHYAHLLQSEFNIQPSQDFQTLVEGIRVDKPVMVPPSLKGSLPPLPTLLIGRESTLADLTERLSLGTSKKIVMQGWPGIGKTTLTAALAHQARIQAYFTGGILWSSLGQEPNLLAILNAWGRSLGFFEIEHARQVDEASARLTAFLKNERILLIIDDVWALDHAVPLNVGGANASVLMTTRRNDVAMGLVDRPDMVYKVPILTESESVELLQTLAPQVVNSYLLESAQLARDLEGLPLALQVAGRLLHAEMLLGWSIIDLLKDMQEGRVLLESQAPADRSEIANQTTPTIAALLQRSIERFSPEMQERFALLGVFAPKPATFSLEAIAAVWDIADARASIRMLVDRGLLEPVGQAHFQMHALLVMLAKSLFEGSL